MGEADRIRRCRDKLDHGLLVRKRSRNIAGGMARNLTCSTAGTRWPAASRWLSPELRSSQSSLDSTRLPRLHVWPVSAWSLNALSVSAGSVFLVRGGDLGSFVHSGGSAHLFWLWSAKHHYAKELPTGRALSLGLEYLMDPFNGWSWAKIPHGIAAVVLLLELLLVACGLYGIFRVYRRGLYLISVVVGQALFILSSGGDWMIGGRFLAPAAIPLVIIEVIGLVTLVSGLRRHCNIQLALGVAAIGGGAMLMVSALPLAVTNAPVWSMRGINDRSLLQTGHYPGASQAWAFLVSDVRCVRGGQLVASTEVGYLGFRARTYACLTSVASRIALLPCIVPRSTSGHGDTDPLVLTHISGRTRDCSAEACNDLVTFDTRHIYQYWGVGIILYR